VWDGEEGYSGKVAWEMYQGGEYQRSRVAACDSVYTDVEV